MDWTNNNIKEITAAIQKMIEDEFFHDGIVLRGRYQKAYRVNYTHSELILLSSYCFVLLVQEIS